MVEKGRRACSRNMQTRLLRECVLSKILFTVLTASLLCDLNNKSYIIFVSKEKWSKSELITVYNRILSL